MSAMDLLRECRDRVLEGWRGRLLASYPSSGRAFLKSKMDASRNPMGSTIEADTSALLGALLAGADLAELREKVDGLVRLRAVQDFTPAQAVGFVFDLKPAARDALGSRAATADGAGALREFEDRVDLLMLAAMDVHAACREQVQDLKAAMFRDRSYMLMKRAGLLWAEDGEKEQTEMTNSMKRGESL